MGRFRAIAARHPLAVPALFYLALAFLLFRTTWVHPATSNIGREGDPPQVMWMLTWTPEALLRGLNPLFTDHLNYPFGVNLMWNALVPLHSLLLWPVTATAGPVVSYNLLVTLNVAGSAWCAYIALTRFVSRRAAALVGGLFYGFSPYMLAQSLDHPTLTAAYIPALLLIVLHEILVRQRRPPLWMGAGLGALAVAQLFIAEEMLACQALIAAIGLLVLVVLYRDHVRSHVRYAVVAFASALGSFLVVTAWPLWFQFFGPQRLTGGTVQARNTFVTDLVNFVVPTGIQNLSPRWAVELSRLHWAGNPSEWGAYLGVPLLVILVFVVARFWSYPIVRVASILALAATVLSLGPNLHVNGHDTGFPLPWRAVEPLPLLGHVLPSRLMVFVSLMVAVLLAVLVEHLLCHPPRAGGGLRAVAVVGVVVTLLPQLAYPSVPLEVPEFFTDGSASLIPDGSVALVAPFQRLYPAEPMLWQAASGMRFRMPQGYFFAPDYRGRPRYGAPPSLLTSTLLTVELGGPQPVLDAGFRAAIAKDLAVREVETVIVGPMPRQKDMLQFLENLLRSPPELIGGVYLWFGADRLMSLAK